MAKTFKGDRDRLFARPIHQYCKFGALFRDSERGREVEQMRSEERWEWVAEVEEDYAFATDKNERLFVEVLREAIGELEAWEAVERARRKAART